MKVELAGRVKNLDLPKSKPLLPLFEAISNSLHSIEDAGITDGRIRIDVLRDPDWMVGESNEAAALPPITGFKITDNGLGFTEENFESFDTCDSLHKQARGAKGIGRLLWLKAFDKIAVRSVFAESGEFRIRTFGFELPRGVTNPKKLPANGSSKPETEVTLSQFDAAYSNCCPKRSITIAEKIIIHLATNFLNPALPIIELFDSELEKPIILNEHFKHLFQEVGKTEHLVVGSHNLTLHHLRLTPHDVSGNVVQLVACYREVDEYPLKSRLAGLASTLTDQQGEHFSYLGIVTGTVLDENVDQNRTAFTLPKGGDLPGSGLPSVEEILAATTDKVLHYLEPFLNSIRKETKNEIEKLIGEEHPEYRPILQQIEKHIDSFPHGAPKRIILKRINEIQFEEEQETRDDGEKLTGDGFVKDSPEYAEKFQSYLRRVTEESEARLAQYVTHRRAIIELLKERLNLIDDSNYDIENAIHELIFPMRRTSDDHGVWAHQNLWLVDERLAYHQYLASDKPLKTVGVSKDSMARPDLLIFNRPALFSMDENATAQPSVTIVEFKRPGRVNLGSDKKDPIEQILGYVQEIKAGGKRDKNGRPITVTPGTSFYAYLICDFEPGSDFDNAALRNLTPSPDKGGYFGFIPNYNVYMEVISFNKLVQDAMMRNRVFFQRLGID